MALHFPPSASPRPSSLYLGVTREKMTTRRLVFDAEKVERMKKLEASRSQVKDPTRVEAVSALLWRSFIAAHKISGAAETGTGTTSFHTAHMVNLRPRAGLPDHTFGNCIVAAPASVSLGEGEDVVSKLRAAVRGVDGDFINEVVKDEKSARAMDESSDVFRKPRNCVFSSWLRMGLYQVDFGWGKPVRFCVGGTPYMNLVLLMEAPPPGNGIEALINVVDDRFFQLVRSNCEKLLGQDFLAT